MTSQPVGTAAMPVDSATTRTATTVSEEVPAAGPSVDGAQEMEVSLDLEMGETAAVPIAATGTTTSTTPVAATTATAVEEGSEESRNGTSRRNGILKNNVSDDAKNATTSPKDRQDDDDDDVAGGDSQTRERRRRQPRHDDPAETTNKESVVAGAFNEFPDAFYCPITRKLMKDPVVDIHGDSYERTAILERDQALEEKQEATYYTNRALKAVIDQALLEKAERRRRSTVQGTLRRMDKSLRHTMRKLIERSAIPHYEHRPLPEVYYCPITFDLIYHPVIDVDGNTYEKVAIEGWVRNNGASPITRNKLTLHDLRPNNAIQDLMEAEKERTELSIHPSIRRWKDAEPPKAIPSESPSSPAPRNPEQQRRRQQARNGQRSSPYPTTMSELERRQQESSRCIATIGVISLGLVLILALIALPYAIAFGIVLVLGFSLHCVFRKRQEALIEEEYERQLQREQQLSGRPQAQEQQQQQQQQILSENLRESVMSV